MHRLLVSRHFDEFVRGALGLVALTFAAVVVAAELVGLAVLLRLIDEAVRR
jgi:hypothetical protein